MSTLKMKFRETFETASGATLPKSSKKTWNIFGRRLLYPRIFADGAYIIDAH